MIKVIIADDHPLFREGLKQIIKKQIDMELCAEVEDGNQLLQILGDKNSDVLILDINLPGRSGLDLIKDIKAIKPKLPILIFSMHPEERFGIRALKAGAKGYISKEKSSAEVLNAIRKLSQGHKYITSELAEKLSEELTDNKNKMPHEYLSEREFEVFRLIASGKTISEIAKMLSLSINTINTYRTRILDKMNMKTNMEIAYYAIENNLLE